MRTILVCLFVLLAVSLSAQTLRAHVEKIPESGGKAIWQVSVDTTLPAQAVLMANLFFHGEEVPASRKRVTIDNGKGVYRYALVASQLPKGVYTCHISYVPRLQSSAVRELYPDGKGFSHELSIVHGTPRQERQEIQSDIRFYQTHVGEAAALLDSVNKQADFFLQQKPPQQLEEVKKWLLQTRERLFLNDKSLLQHQSAFLLVRTAENAADLAQLFAAVAIVCKVKMANAARHYELPMPPEWQQIAAKNPPDSLPQLASKIEQLGERILARLPVGENLREEHLEKDLLWFNGVFIDMAIHYQQMTREWQADKWQEKIVFWQEELADFESQIKLYQESPLAEENLFLISDLRILVKTGQDLAVAYTAALYKKKNLQLPSGMIKVKATPPELLLKLQDTFAYLYRIPAQQRQYQEEQELIVWQEMRAAHVATQQLYAELQKPPFAPGTNGYRGWQEQWNERLLNMQENTDFWQEYFPELSRDFVSLARLLDKRRQFHVQSLSAKEASRQPTTEVRQLDLTWRSKWQELGKALSQPLPPRK